MKTPVVIFIYKRSDNLKKIISVLRKIHPTSLYIVSDGSKYIEEKVKVDQTIRIIESLINWECEINKNYSNINLGLKERFRSGIDWVFEHTDSAIFIEDDCIPDPTFFQFCDELLEKYKDDERIFSISGNNFLFGKARSKESYYFSRYPHVWGWATWKRVWDKYDSNISDWPELRQVGLLNKVFPNNFFIRKFWTYIFDRLYAGKINTWDYQLTYLSFKNNGLNIIPSVNLVTNVGYGKDSTNIKSKNQTIGVPTHSMEFPLIHPKNIIASMSNDHHIDNLVYLNLVGKISLFIKSVLGIL